jgi:hypothetical protein
MVLYSANGVLEVLGERNEYNQGSCHAKTSKIVNAKNI